MSETNGSIHDEELLLQLEERTKQLSSLQEQLSAVSKRAFLFKMHAFFNSSVGIMYYILYIIHSR